MLVRRGLSLWIPMTLLNDFAIARIKTPTTTYSPVAPRSNTIGLPLLTSTYYA